MEIDLRLYGHKRNGANEMMTISVTTPDGNLHEEITDLKGLVSEELISQLEFIIEECKEQNRLIKEENEQ